MPLNTETVDFWKNWEYDLNNEMDKPEFRNCKNSFNLAFLSCMKKHNIYLDPKDMKESFRHLLTSLNTLD